MNKEAEIFLRDSIRINILSEILNGSAEIKFQLDNENTENYKNDIHTSGRRVYLYGCMNFSEDSSGEYLKIRPVSIKNKLTAELNLPNNIENKKILVKRDSTKTEELLFDITSDISKIELIPSNEKYILRIIKSESTKVSRPKISVPNVVNTNRQIQAPVQNSTVSVKVPENVSQKNSDSSTRAENHRKMLAISNENKKDYPSKQQELIDLAEMYKVDKSIVEYYKDREVKPIEDIFAEIERLLGEAEKQISVFVNARQSKTMQIENDVKSNKGQN